MKTKIRLALSAALVTVAKSAWAVVVVGNFAGAAYDGTDTSGVFGAAGGDLTGAALTGTYSYDTDLLASMVAGSVNSATGSPGAITASVAIGGQSFTFSDSLGSNVTLDASTGEVDVSLTNGSGDNYEALSFGFIPTTNELNGTDLAQSFAVPSFYSSLGSFLIADTVNQANGDFTLSSIAQSVPSTAVPEPASAALLLLPVVALAALGRRAGGRKLR